MITGLKATEMRQRVKLYNYYRRKSDVRWQQQKQQNKNARACLPQINTKRKCSDSLPDGHIFTMYANICQQIQGHSISLSFFSTFFSWISTPYIIKIGPIAFPLFRRCNGLECLFGWPKPYNTNHSTYSSKSLEQLS